MKGNLLIVQGGGPTPVLNISLAAAIESAREFKEIGKILGAVHGMDGLLKGKIVDLTGLSQAQVNLLKQTPGAALGTTRYKPTIEELNRMVDRLAEMDVCWLVVIGGNGSLTGADAISNAAKRNGYDLCAIGAPKTIDNDIVETDRCPGYGSAAKYVAQSVRDLGMDVRALPQPVSVMETMGRSVGWLAAAAALAKRDENDAPHLVYLPEKAFSMEKAISDVDRIVRKLGWCIVVVNEGLKDADGKPIFESALAQQKDACDRALPGGVGAFVAESVSAALKIRVRSEKPGLIGRASMYHVSERDRNDAEIAGREAVRAAMEGETGKMVGLRDGNNFELVPLEKVRGRDRHMPAEYLEDSDIGVSRKFLEYVRPLIGELLEYSAPLAEMMPTIKPPMASAVRG
ncbi:MAG TPA: diphosphate--fructose-6-phosphate 1-phosphotransferase [Tepidisphaeraceae bacterium]